MELTKERKGVLALAMLNQMTIEEAFTMSDSAAKSSVESLADLCKHLPVDLAASNEEIFSLFREMLSGSNREAFDRAVARLNQSETEQPPAETPETDFTGQ